MDIQGLGQPAGIGPARMQPPVNAPTPEPLSPTFMPRDEVEISSLSQRLDELGGVGGLREERLASIKAAIDSGTYETSEKLNIAVDRMLNQLLGDLD